jgi:hypothetical protein
MDFCIKVAQQRPGDSGVMLNYFNSLSGVINATFELCGMIQVRIE